MIKPEIFDGPNCHQEITYRPHLSECPVCAKRFSLPAETYLPARAGFLGWRGVLYAAVLLGGFGLIFQLVQRADRANALEDQRAEMQRVLCVSCTKALAACKVCVDPTVRQ